MASFDTPKNMRALLVGCEYHNTPNYLPGCINDVLCIKNFLLLKNVPPQNIEVMTDTIGRRPTKEMILHALKKLIEKGNEEPTTLFFHFSGHGSYVPDIYHISPEEADGHNECLIPLGMVRSARDVIIDNELHSIISKLNDKSKLFLLTDCCHSGTCFDLPYSYRELKDLPPKLQESEKKNYTDYPNIVKLSGCQDSQVSQSIRHERVWKGALTLTFISTIEESKTWSDLFEKSHAFLKKMHLSQKPVLSSNKKGDLGDVFI